MRASRSNYDSIRPAWVAVVSVLMFCFSTALHAQQFSRPDSTISGGSWTVTGAPTHHEALDEVSPVNSDRITSDALNQNAQIGLSNITDPVSSSGHILRWRAWGDRDNQGERLELWSGGVMIRQHNYNIPGRRSWQTLNYTLSAAEADAITDYSDLSVRFINRSDEEVRISWFEFEVPDAVAATPPTVTSPTVSGPTDTAATLGGNVTDDGGDALTARGTVWNTTGAPITENQLAEGGTSTGPFSHVRSGLPAGTQVFYRAYATNGQGTSYSSDASFFTEPATQAGGISFSNVTSDSMRVSWTPGSGDGSLVVIRTASSPSGPSDGTLHSASPVFGSGADLGGGSFVVFRAAGSQVDVTGLAASTTHFVAIYEFAGSVADSVPGSITGINYKPAPATGSQATTVAADPPTVTTPTVANVTATTADLGGNVSADGGAPITSRGTVWNTTGAPITESSLAEGGTTTGVFSHTRNALPAATQIFYRAYASNNAGTSFSGDDSFYTEPAASPASVSIDTVTPDSFRVTWPAPASGDGTIIVVSGNPVSATPSDGVEHTFNAAFGSGADLGGSQFVVFRGGGTEVTLTDLSAATTYHVAAFHYAGSGSGSAGINYRQDTPATNSATTDAAQSVPALDASTFGSVTATSAVLGGNVSADGGSAVTARGTFWNTSGAPITENQLAEGGTGTGPFSHLRGGMPGGSIVWARAYATNVNGTGFGPSVSFYTDPANSPLSVTIDTVASGSVRVSWPAPPAGDGDGAIVVVREASPVAAAPVDGVEHTASATFGAGEDLGAGEYVVYRGNATEVTVVGLASETTYHVAVFYSAGTGAGAGGINYRQASPAAASQLTGTATNEPSIQASNIIIDVVASRSLRIKWTRGNGDGSIVVIRTQGTGRVPPLDSSQYSADKDFTLAPETSPGSGNFVVYKGTSNSINVNGLTPSTTYVINVYAWGGSGSEIDYLQALPPEVTQGTVGPDMHNYNNGADCTDCHSNHGGAGLIPHGDNQADACRTCHNPTGPASAKLNFSLHKTPNYAAGDVECGNCHEIHRIVPGASETTESTHPLTLATQHNEKFIRANVQEYVPTATTDDAVYHTLKDDLAIEGGDALTSRGICQACHTQVGYHRHDGTGEQCHAGDTLNCDPFTNGGTDCTNCHKHEDYFAPTGGDCTQCHDTSQGGAPPSDRRPIVPEFARLSHHVPGTLSPDDCVTCHAQNPQDNDHLHNGPGDKRVTLWNVDNHAISYQLGVYAEPTATAADAALLTPFCLNCHDADGAQAEATPASPFTLSGAPPDIEATWSTSSHASNPGNPLSCFGDGQFGCHGSGHGSEKLKLLADAATPATAPDFAEEEEGFCFNCHDGSPASTNLQAEFAKAFEHPIVDSQQGIGRTVECTNCHNPHVATASLGAPGPGTTRRSATGPLQGIDGINTSGTPVSPASYEYEVCFSCHGPDPDKPAAPTPRQFVQTDVISEFNGTSASYHPVTTTGAGTNVPSLINGWSTSSIMSCTNCHNNNSGPATGGSGTNGPHGSTIAQILERRYDRNDPSEYAQNKYALCFNCHSASNILGDNASSFGEHDKHLRNADVGCNVCHDPHASENPRLINFDTSVVSPQGGTLEFIWNAPGSGNCTLNCHGEAHNNRSY